MNSNIVHTCMMKMTFKVAASNNNTHALVQKWSPYKHLLVYKKTGYIIKHPRMNEAVPSPAVKHADSVLKTWYFPTQPVWTRLFKAQHAEVWCIKLFLWSQESCTRVLMSRSAFLVYLSVFRPNTDRNCKHCLINASELVTQHDFYNLLLSTARISFFINMNSFRIPLSKCCYLKLYF